MHNGRLQRLHLDGHSPQMLPSLMREHKLHACWAAAYKRYHDNIWKFSYAADRDLRFSAVSKNLVLEHVHHTKPKAAADSVMKLVAANNKVRHGPPGTRAPLAPALACTHVRCAAVAAALRAAPVALRRGCGAGIAVCLLWRTQRHGTAQGPASRSALLFRFCVRCHTLLQVYEALNASSKRVLIWQTQPALH